MKLRISERMSKPDFQGDFTAAILKAAASPDVISFAGGLPNPDSFPVKEMEAAVTKVLERDGVRTMRINYSNSSDEAIEKGIKILGDTIKEMLAK